jgi:hypothetical protein
VTASVAFGLSVGHRAQQVPRIGPASGKLPEATFDNPQNMVFSSIFCFQDFLQKDPKYIKIGCCMDFQERVQGSFDNFDTGVLRQKKHLSHNPG